MTAALHNGAQSELRGRPIRGSHSRILSKDSSPIHAEFIAVCCHVVAGIRRKEEITPRPKPQITKRNKLLNSADTGRCLDG